MTTQNTREIIGYRVKARFAERGAWDGSWFDGFKPFASREEAVLFAEQLNDRAAVRIEPIFADVV